VIKENKKWFRHNKKSMTLIRSGIADDEFAVHVVDHWADFEDPKTSSHPAPA